MIDRVVEKPFITMSTTYTYADFLAAINWLVAEGYIERFVDDSGAECVRICQGAETAEI